VGVEEEVEDEEVVFAKTPTTPAGHVAERIGNEEGERPDSLSGQLGAFTQPVAEQVFLAKILARLGEGHGARFAEQVVRVLARALAGGALRRLVRCRRVRL